MPKKQNSIYWRSSDEAELSRTVKNYNAKITRLLNKNPALKDVLPEKISKREIKNQIESRSDFNKQVKSAQRFSKKGSEEVISNKYGLEITKYERREIGIKLGIINRHRTIERKAMENLDVVNQGKKTGFKRGEMGSVRMTTLKPKKFNFATMSKQNYSKFVESLNKQAEAKYTHEKQERFKQNYITALERMIPKANQNIIDAVKNTPASQVVKTLYENQNAEIQFIYDPVEQLLKLQVLTDIWVGM